MNVSTRKRMNKSFVLQGTSLQLRSLQFSFAKIVHLYVRYEQITQFFYKINYTYVQAFKLT